MEAEKIHLCHNLIKEIKLCKSIKEKYQLRNHLFSVMKDQIIKWIKSYSASIGRFYDEQELMSMSWDCFLFSLKHYKIDREIPIPNHFYSYIKFFLKTENRKSVKEKSLGKRFGENYLGALPYSNNFDAEGDLEELKKFREMLDEELSEAFDDALASMKSSTKDRKTRKDKKGANKYYDRKRIFKIIIDFLIRR